MKKSRPQMEKELEGKAQEIIKRLLDWNETHPAPDLTQIEDIVLELREQVGLEFAASLLNNQEKAEPVAERCQKCGREMHNKGRKRKIVESRIGGVELERGYYYCPECGAGLFPPGSTVAGGEAQTE